MGSQLREGEFTGTIYGFIKEQKYTEAVQVLTQQLYAHPTSRAALSLLGYCYFQMQDFVNASDCYEQLAHYFPTNEEYKLYFALSLYKAFLFEPAMKVFTNTCILSFSNCSLKCNDNVCMKDAQWSECKHFRV